MSSPTGYAKGRAQRAHILDVARRMIEDNGLAGLSVRAIAREAGLSQAGLHHHFATRDRLLEAIIEEQDSISLRRGLRPDQRPYAFVGQAERNSHEPGWVKLFTRLAAEVASDDQHPSRAFFTERYAQMRELVASQIRIAQEEGVLPEEHDPTALAVLFIAAMDGLQVQWLLDPSVRMDDHLTNLRRIIKWTEDLGTDEAPTDRSSTSRSQS